MRSRIWRGGSSTIAGWRSRIIKLIQEVQRTPYEGTGQPEQLKHELSGCWSRRINQEHRLIYEVSEDTGNIRILACRYHY
jgi:toxin YoeB